MSTKDFRASQVETSKLIASGGITGTTAGLVIYSGSIASDRAGNRNAGRDTSDAGTGNVGGNFDRGSFQDAVKRGELKAEVEELKGVDKCKCKN